MRWNSNELIYEMEQDPQLRILFVEGVRDQTFWQESIAPQRRSGTVIYPVSVLEIPVNQGGERGRLLFAANEFVSSNVTNRVRFVADCDCDRVVGNPVPTNVHLTDGRDLESYYLMAGCLDVLCRVTFAGRNISTIDLVQHLRTVLRPMAIVRLVSHKKALALPFAKLIQKHKPNRFVSFSNSGVPSFDQNEYLRLLIQNAGLHQQFCATVSEDCVVESARQASIPDEHLIHGKDLVWFLAFIFRVDESEIERLLFSTLHANVARILNLQTISTVRAWLC